MSMDKSGRQESRQCQNGRSKKRRKKRKKGEN